jgi:hypothetical protein
VDHNPLVGGSNPTAATIFFEIFSKMWLPKVTGISRQSRALGMRLSW